MYSTVTGDSFESVSRKVYGFEKEAARIARANPGTTEPLVEGTKLAIPVLPGAPKDKTGRAESATPDEVAVFIAGERFRFWTEVRIGRALDNLDTVSFEAPFDSTVQGMRDTFRPFSYLDLEVTVGGTPLFKGTLVSVTPTIEPSARRVSVTGYATPGVMGDCTMPASAYPLEFNNQTLTEIATALAAPFGVTVEADTDVGTPFARVSVSVGAVVLPFLADLAKQRGTVLRSTASGALLITKAIDVGAPVARFRQGAAPLMNVSPRFSPQKYFSHITGVVPAGFAYDGTQFTTKNTHIEGVVRPFTYEVTDTADADAQTAVDAKLGRMFGSAVVYSVTVSTWRDELGGLWAPNTLVTLLAPDVMVYNEYTFLVRSVAFSRNGDATTATLELVPPGAFNGVLPRGLPWEA